jgi:hypothetical protein
LNTFIEEYNGNRNSAGLKMQGRFFYLVVAVTMYPFDLVGADRYVPVKDSGASENESTSSTSTSSGSFEKSLGFIRTWIMVILLLGLFLFLVEKMLLCCSGLFASLISLGWVSSL